MEQVEQEYFHVASIDALIRYRVKAERYGLVRDWNGITNFYESINSDGLVLSWEHCYEMILREMDKIEEQARTYEFEPMGTEQHYGDLEYKKIFNGCVCAGCWGELTARKIPAGWELYCVRCGTDRGFHSRYYSALEKSRDKRYAAEAWKRLTAGGMVFDESDNRESNQSVVEEIQLFVQPS